MKRRVHWAEAPPRHASRRPRLLKLRLRQAEKRWRFGVASLPEVARCEPSDEPVVLRRPNQPQTLQVLQAS